MGRELHVPEDAGSNAFQGCVIVLNSPLYVNMALLEFGCGAHTFSEIHSKLLMLFYRLISFRHHSTRCFLIVSLSIFLGLTHLLKRFATMTNLFRIRVSFNRVVPPRCELVRCLCFSWPLKTTTCRNLGASRMPRKFTSLDWKPHHVQDLASLIVLSRV